MKSRCFTRILLKTSRGGTQQPRSSGKIHGDVYLYLQCFLMDDPWEEAMKKGPLVI